MNRKNFLSIFIVFFLFYCQPAQGKLLLESQISAGPLTVFRDSSERNKNTFYYLPTPRLSTHEDGTPKISLWKYVKTGKSSQEDLVGGILHMVITMGATEQELAEAKKALGEGKYMPHRKRKKGASSKPKKYRKVKLNAINFEEGTFSLISGAVGEEGGFGGKVFGTGNAPVMPGAEVAVSIALSPEGATFMDKVLGSQTYPLDVNFDMVYRGLTPTFKAEATIDYSRIRDYWEKHTKSKIYQKKVAVGKIFGKEVWRREWYVHTGDREEHRLQDVLKETGSINVEIEGEDEDQEALLNSLTNQVMSNILNTMGEREEFDDKDDSNDGEEGDEGDDDNDEMNYGVRIDHRKIVSTGKHTFSMSTSKYEKRNTGPLRAKIDEAIRQYKGDERVFQVIDLDDPDFQMNTIHVSLDMEGEADFGNFINYVNVEFEKSIRNEKKSGVVSFTRKSFGESGNLLHWRYPRLGVKGYDWLEYRYRVIWSLAGGIKVQEPWKRSREFMLGISAPCRYRTIYMGMGAEQAESEDIRLISVKFKHKLFNKTKGPYEYILRPQEDNEMSFQYYHPHKDLSYSYMVTYHLGNNKNKKTKWLKTDEPYINLDL